MSYKVFIFTYVKPIKPKQMKAILIDVFNNCVKSVSIDENDTLKSMYRLIGCSLVDRVQINSHDDIWVDDEGLLSINNDSRFFTFGNPDLGGYQPLAGNGLIMGVDKMGKSIDPTITIDEVRARVKFYSLSEVQKLYEGV
jgi:hypothetical protein